MSFPYSGNGRCTDFNKNVLKDPFDKTLFRSYLREILKLYYVHSAFLVILKWHNQSKEHGVLLYIYAVDGFILENLKFIYDIEKARKKNAVWTQPKFYSLISMG